MQYIDYKLDSKYTSYSIDRNELSDADVDFLKWFGSCFGGEFDEDESVSSYYALNFSYSQGVPSITMSSGTGMKLAFKMTAQQVKFKKQGSSTEGIKTIEVNSNGYLIINTGYSPLYCGEITVGFEHFAWYQWASNNYLDNAKSLLELSINRKSWTDQKFYKQQDMALLWKNYCINNKCINAQGFYTTSWETITSSNSYNNQQIKNHNFNFITSLWFVNIAKDLSDFYYTENNEWYYYYDMNSEQYHATYGPFYIIEIDTTLECDASKCANTSFYFDIKQTSPKYYFLPTTHNPNKTLRQELEEITTGWTTTQLLETKEVSRTFSSTDISVTYNVLYPKTDFQWEYSNYVYPFISSYNIYPQNCIIAYGTCDSTRVLLKYNLGNNNTLAHSSLNRSSDLSTVGNYDYLRADGSHFDGSTAGSLFYQQFHNITIQTLGCDYPISIKNETIPSIGIDHYKTNPGFYEFSWEGLGTSYNHYFTGKKISQNGNYYNTWEQDGVYTWWYDKSDSSNKQYHFRNIIKRDTKSKLYYIFVARNIDNTHY